MALDLDLMPDVETASDGYASRFSGAVGAWFLQVQERAMLRMLRSWPGARVLEVGGGHGQVTAALVRAGYRVTVHGSDERCRARIQPLLQAGACEFKAGPLLSLPFADGSFDAVIALRLLAHMPTWPALVGELTRVARTAVFVDYPPVRSFNCLVPWLFERKRLAEGNTRPFLTFRDQDMDAAFTRHGFRLAGAHREFFWPMVVHRRLGQAALSRALEAPCRAVGLTRWLGSPVIAAYVRDAAR